MKIVLDRSEPNFEHERLYYICSGKTSIQCLLSLDLSALLNHNATIKLHNELFMNTDIFNGVDELCVKRDN